MTTNELLKQAYVMIRDLKKKVQDSSHAEEIAVVGMACRFPGGCDTPEEYWRFLKEGRDAAIDVPADRWNIDEYYDPVHGTPGKMYIRKANFMQRDPAAFDARFFRISPTEASAMDPQQRQLLEVSWEALENAGQNPTDLVGSRTGVFIGINSTCEYTLIPRSGEYMNQYLGTGTTSSIASGRVSYVFGFNGPTLSVDTACSSSLVSTLLAVDALRNGGCDMALAGGVNMLLSPISMAALCMMNALAESGRSAPFDESADGYGRGEGCGILVLKRLSDAKKDGDRIYALICGGAVNNDGASSGLTVPNGNAQRMVIQDALKNCGLKPEDISYLETHGTGTALGDPIEVKAITEVFGKTRREKPLVLGAVKGNIGHLESAAGVAGLIKVILSLYHGEIVPVCNFKKQNPRVNFSGIPAVLPLECRLWEKEGEKERAAGISSFGFSGTNAHIILKEAPAREPVRRSGSSGLNTLCISAKDRTALLKLLREYDEYLDSCDASITDICYTANTTRAQFAVRCAMTGVDRVALRDAVIKKREWLEAHPELPEPITTNPKFAFLFSGKQLLLNHEAGRKLLRYPGFENRFGEIVKTVGNVIGQDEADRIGRLEEDETGVTGELRNIALRYAMARWTVDMGMRPEIASGAGSGAYLAAMCAGVLSVESAMSLFARENGLTARNTRIVTEHPRCRYVSVSEKRALQKVTEEDLLRDIRLGETDIAETGMLLRQEGYRYMIGFGPDTYGPAFNEKDTVAMILLRGDPDEETARMLAVGFEEGAPIRFGSFYRPEEVNKTVLPGYPFAGNRYWIRTAEEEDAKNGEAFGRISRRGLDGLPLNLPGKQKQTEYTFTLDNFRELKDNNGMVHIGYYLEMLRDNMEQHYPDTGWYIRKMDFVSPILVMGAEKKQVFLSLEEREDEDLSFTFYSKNLEEENWRKNVSGQIVLSELPEIQPVAEEHPSSERNKKETGEAFYTRLEERGLTFGKAVRWVESIARSGKQAEVTFRAAEAGENGYHLGFHPGIADSCAQVCNYLTPAGRKETKKYMISSLTDVITEPGTEIGNGELHASVRLKEKKKDELICEILLRNGEGKRLLSIREVHLKSFDEELILRMSQSQTAPGQSGADHAFVLRYTETPEREQQELLAGYIRALLADVLGMQPDEIGLDEKVEELGLDSMSGMIFHQRLTQSLSLELSFLDIMESGTCMGTAKVLMPYLPGGRKYRKQITGEQRTPYDADLSVPHWIYNYRNKPEASMRLFCFPYGFGSASMYKEWQQFLGDEVEVCPIKIPGLDAERMREMPASDIDELMEVLDRVVGDTLLDKPCATFGNSWGSLFSYRMAYRLSKDPRADLKACFISGYTSPSLPNTSLEQILSELRRIGYDHIPTDQELRETASLEEISRAFVSAWGQSVQSEENAVSGTKLTLTLIASAYRLIEHYRYDPKEQFTVPIIGFHGIDDYRVPLEDMNAWENVTKGEYLMYTVPGDHAFIEKDQSEARVIELLKQEIRKRF